MIQNIKFQLTQAAQFFESENEGISNVDPNKVKKVWKWSTVWTWASYFPDAFVQRQNGFFIVLEVEKRNVNGVTGEVKNCLLSYLIQEKVLRFSMRN